MLDRQINHKTSQNVQIIEKRVFHVKQLRRHEKSLKKYKFHVKHFGFGVPFHVEQ